MNRHPIGHANRIALLAWAALLTLVGGMIWERLDAVRAGHAWVGHTEKVMLSIKDLEIALRDIQSGERGYLLTADEQQLQAYDKALGTVGFKEGELQRLTADNPRQQDRLRVLASLIAHRLETVARILQVRRDNGLDAALRLMRERDSDSDIFSIDRQVGMMADEEQTILGLRLRSTMSRSNWLSVMALVGAALVVMVLLWTGRTLNAAWARTAAMEARQRTLAERLSASLDSLSQGVAVFDADRRMTNCNPCLAGLLNLPDGMTRTGLPYADLAAHLAGAQLAEGTLKEDLLESDEQVRRSGPQAPGEAVAYERTRPDGQHLEVRRTPMRGGGFVLTISDMTKRMQAEAVLREAQKMQAIGQLTGGIAHDFNNLLTVILGNLDTLQSSRSNDPATQKRIDRAVWAAQRGATLTAQLLAFARKQPLAPAPLDLSRTVPDLVPLLQRTLGAPIEFRLIGAAGLWPAMADAAQLESALLNLALNARDAMPNGGCLTIELANTVLDTHYARNHAEVTAGDYVMLAVSDTGSGMSPAVIARAFEPFYTTKPDGKGTGLGLAMVFGFVKQSKGHVKIYSEVGEGTAIKLYLPRAVGGTVQQPGDPQSGQAAPRAPSPRMMEPMRLAATAKTILVVEDEFDVREVAVSILTDYGYHVLEAANGEEALRVVEAHSAAIDLLLTDVVLPGTLRGRDIAERVTELRPGVRVLFMSGYTENSIVHHGRLDDGVRLIGKPFNRQQLAARVADLLNETPAAASSANRDQSAG